VVRGYRQDAVRVHIPRCEACQNRNWISGFLVITGFMVGGVVGIGFPSWGWTVWVGAVVGGVPLLLGIILYARLSGRRSIDAYPPLQRLRQAGWTDPN
jgi:hypothetical protein